jgi:hypothetical protein
MVDVNDQLRVGLFLEKFISDHASLYYQQLILALKYHWLSSMMGDPCFNYTGKQSTRWSFENKVAVKNVGVCCRQKK